MKEFLTSRQIILTKTVFIRLHKMCIKINLRKSPDIKKSINKFFYDLMLKKIYYDAFIIKVMLAHFRLQLELQKLQLECDCLP